jgi:hypothetical protein
MNATNQATFAVSSRRLDASVHEKYLICEGFFAVIS